MQAVIITPQQPPGTQRHMMSVHCDAPLTVLEADSRALLSLLLSTPHCLFVLTEVLINYVCSK